MEGDEEGGKASMAQEEARTQGSAPTPLSGLTSAQVADRVAQGLVNVDASPKTKSILQIVADHAFTLFNAVNILLAALVFITGSYRNMLFLLIVFANMAIGIFQEIRSKMAVDQLSILAERPAKVVRDGAQVEVPPHEIVQGDLVVLSHGDQVPADLCVREGDVYMNESLLTGESCPVEKHVGDELLSGSFVASGAVKAEAMRVGAASYAARINDEAKQAKPVNSEIMTTLKMIIRFGTWVLVPVGIALFLRSYFSGIGLNDSILSTVADVIGMIPQGLVLLTSTVLAIATMRLALNKVLVQQLYCIETLARVDVLCLDKTGTITAGVMEIRDVRALSDVSEADVLAAMATVAKANEADANETAMAVLEYANSHDVEIAPIARAIPFSSERKYSGCVTQTGEAFVFGAGQFVLRDRFGEVEADVRSFPATSRVLVVCRCEGFDGENAIIGEPEVLGIVSISDHVRESAPKTLEYFRRQGVTLKIISGDDPATVAAIAKEAGVKSADSWVDASTLADDAALADAALRYTVFGRVTPQQKKGLLLALKAHGHTVAMTGDGVNDVLALREADCSVAMASGSDAARTVAEIVLVDNDFAHMPEVVDEGRRSINNLQRSASLFLEKTVFSMAVGVLCILLPPYPMLPIQLSLISGSLIGIPSFVLALEPNHDRVEGNFLAHVLSRSMPASVAVTIGLACVVVARTFLGLSTEQVSTIATCVTSVVGIWLIWRLSQPLNLLRSALLVATILEIVFGVTLFGWFFEMAPLTWPMVGFLAAVSVVTIIIFEVLWRHARRNETPEGIYGRFAKKVEERSHGKASQRSL